MTKRYASLLILVISIVFPAMVQAQAPTTGLELLNAMHKAYKGKWYPIVSFKQETVFYKDGKSDRTETWYEIMKPEKGLLIKFGSMDSGSGLIFRQDSQFVYKDDALISKKRQVHELIVLGFSVYTDQADVTASKLKEAGFDLSHFSTETIDGVLHYVVGDPAKAQFWIESKKLVFTKLRKTNSNGVVTEVAFNKYIKLGGGWIEQEVLFYRNGVLTMSEMYNDIKVPSSFDDRLISNDKFSAKRW